MVLPQLAISRKGVVTLSVRACGSGLKTAEGSGEAASGAQQGIQSARGRERRLDPMQRGEGVDGVEGLRRGPGEQVGGEELRGRAGQTGLFEQGSLDVDAGEAGAGGSECGGRAPEAAAGVEHALARKRNQHFDEDLFGSLQHGVSQFAAGYQ